MASKITVTDWLTVWPDQQQRNTKVPRCWPFVPRTTVQECVKSFCVMASHVSHTTSKASTNCITQSWSNARLAPSQWETSLHSNTVSHWPSANLESVLLQPLCVANCLAHWGPIMRTRLRVEFVVMLRTHYLWWSGFISRGTLPIKHVHMATTRAATGHWTIN